MLKLAIATQYMVQFLMFSTLYIVSSGRMTAVWLIGKAYMNHWTSHWLIPKN